MSITTPNSHQSQWQLQRNRLRQMTLLGYAKQQGGLPASACSLEEGGSVVRPAGGVIRAIVSTVDVVSHDGLPISIIDLLQPLLLIHPCDQLNRFLLLWMLLRSLPGTHTCMAYWVVMSICPGSTLSALA